MSGDFSADGASAIEIDSGLAGDVIIMTEGDVEITGSAEVSGYVYAGGKLEMQGSGTINGSAVASTIEMNGSGTLNYEQGSSSGAATCP